MKEELPEWINDKFCESLSKQGFNFRILNINGEFYILIWKNSLEEEVNIRDEVLSKPIFSRKP